ncbi:MAG: phosphate butyryltransferase [Anaerophaga sp.]|uniref:bifunctional enoyl-CoA hydratase/phosphate acetyltransferase n=1 Tax=Anaerophaga thermohalophila TaxID=177400 RepID=UPI000237C466|nr:bifunctional enoyl-CoA hydratase/phosphate acetyltransferase [Anaerophaga thermohalophila]MBZ4677369.1 phosphate butyryltransferase [Anaerophaga sp.]MDK2842607.1 phosphate butyryltransferase [Anaerophaga sp.]
MFKHLSDLQNQIDPSKPAKKLALAVSQDNFSLNALYKAYKAGFISPVLIGDREETYHIIEERGYDFGNSTFIGESDPEKCVEIAVRMVHDGKADVLMKGKVSTPVLLRGVLNKDWGLRTGRLLSHLAFFEVATYHKLIAVTDVAMNIAPTLRDKICIVENSVQYLNTLGIKRPKVAVLGAIEMVNESMQATTDAALLSKMNQRDQIKNCIIDGPLAFDNAVSFESAHHKNIKSEVAGDTDLLLMPDIEVGNVLYKSLVFFANAKVASVILGASAPIVLTSRSDTEESKFYSILLAVLA